MAAQTLEAVVFDPAETTVTINNTYVTGFGSSAISFDYSQDAIKAEAGLDGAVVFAVNKAKLGTCSLSLKISSPQMNKLLDLARNNTMFPIWCVNKTIGRRAGGNKAMFARVPSYTADESDVTFNIIIADMVIESC